MAAKKNAKKTQVKKTAKKKNALLRSSRAKVPRWDLKLYIAGNTDRSIAAFNNLKAICEEHLAGQYSIEIIDLLVRPQLAKGDQILALPTVVRKLPAPIKKLIGDFSNSERVLVGLNIKPANQK